MFCRTYVCVHIHVCSAIGGQKRVLDPLEVELQEAMSHHVGPGTLAPLTAEPSFHSLISILKSGSNLALVATHFHPTLTPISLSPPIRCFCRSKPWGTH